MSVRKVGLALTSALLATTLLACGSTGSGGGAPAQGGQVTGDLNTVNSAENVGPGEMTFAIEKTIPNWNTISATGDISETVWVTAPLYPSTFIVQPDGTTVEMNDDLLESAEEVKDDPTVVEYKIKKEAVWSDGVPITADDFIWQWKVLNSRDCKDCVTHDTDGLDHVTSVKGSDDGKTVTVTYDDRFSEWRRGFNRLLPAHIAAEHGDLAESFTWFGENAPTFSGGPYIISDFKQDVSVTLEPNPEWWGEKPHLSKITFRMITDTQQTPVALQNKEVQAMYPQPQVDLLEQIKQMEQLGVKYQLNQSLVMEAVRFNESNSFLADMALRQAIVMAMNNQEIIDKTVGQFDERVKPLGNAMIMQQQQGYEDHMAEVGYGAGDVEGAKKHLTDAGYTITDGQLMTPEGKPVPPLRLVYSVGNAVRESNAEIIAAAVKPLGITMKLETTDSLGDTTSENKPYGYDIVILGYTGQPFLAANAAKRYKTGTGYNPHYSNPDVDDLIDEASRAKTPEETIELINKADRQMIEDVFVIPMYQKSSLMAYYSEYGNVRDNPTMSGPTYNIQDWGIVPS